MKVQVTERDLELFVKANPALSRKSGLVDKEDLLEILGDSFRQARFQFIEKNQTMNIGRYDDLSLDVPSHNQSYSRD